MSNISMNLTQIKMLYHTNIRNIALYTSVSLALLGYSRYYRQTKYQIYNISFIIISLSFLLMSMFLSLYLLKDHKVYLDKLVKEKKYTNKDIIMLEKWYIVPKISLVITSIIGLFGLYTLLREIKIKK